MLASARKYCKSAKGQCHKDLSICKHHLRDSNRTKEVPCGNIWNYFQYWNTTSRKKSK